MTFLIVFVHLAVTNSAVVNLKPSRSKFIEKMVWLQMLTRVLRTTEDEKLKSVIPFVYMLASR